MMESDATHLDQKYIFSESGQGRGQLRPANTSGAVLNHDDLTGRAFLRSMIASNASIQAALEPVKLFECICEGGPDLGSGLTVQTLDLD
jgi:hypothetical protein